MRRLPALVPIMILFPLGLVECRAQSATAETSGPPILPAHTPVILRLKKNLYKKDAKPGQPVEFEVGFDVVVNGEVFIQSGAAVTGSIRQVDPTGERPAKVPIHLGPTQTISGEMVRLAGPGTTTASDQPGVADAISWGAEAWPVLPVFVVMSLFEKKVLLDKNEGCGWFGGLGGCGVWVVAHVAENVALDPAKQKAAQAQYTAKQRAAEIEHCRLLQSRNPESSLDEGALFFSLFSVDFKARLLQQAGDLDAAIEEYQQDLARKPDCPGLRESVPALSLAPLHFGLAELFREKRDFVHAIPEYRTAVQLDPNDQRYEIGLVNALEDSGDLDTALFEVNEAIRIWAYNSAYFHYLLGRLLVKKNDPDAAIAELQWVLKQEKNHDWKASCALGSAYELKGDLKAALGQYRTAYRVHMDDEKCRAAYERLHSQLKK
jgi:tetratricopeptide (TPR) repeat protein